MIVIRSLPTRLVMVQQTTHTHIFSKCFGQVFETIFVSVQKGSYVLKCVIKLYFKQAEKNMIMK